MKLSLGFSPCPNDTFMFDAMLHGKLPANDIEFDTSIEDVETLNEWAMEGRLDVTKLSYNAYLRVRDEYVLLNAGSALGYGCGPLLIARAPLDDDAINVGPIGLPGELTTAHMLFSLRFPKAENKRFMVFHEIEQRLLDGEISAGVIIHENRFTYAKKGLVEVTDLGAWWEQETKSPIPLGAIVVRRSLGKEVHTRLERLISASVEYAFNNPESSKDFVRCHAQEMSPSVMRQHIDTYVNAFSIDLGVAGHRAVAELERRAQEAGMISA